jgi:hypothetical protein
MALPLEGIGCIGSECHYLGLLPSLPRKIFLLRFLYCLVNKFADFRSCLKAIHHGHVAVHENDLVHASFFVANARFSLVSEKSIFNFINCFEAIHGLI